MLEGFREKKDEVTARARRSSARSPATLGAKSAEGARRRAISVTKLEEDRFHLVVVGEFNHGKIDVRECAARRERARRPA